MQADMGVNNTTASTTIESSISEWFLLQAIQLVTDNLPESTGSNEDSVLTDLAGHTWKLYHASHWEKGEHAPIGVEENYRGIILFCPTLQKALLVHRGLQLTSPENLTDGFCIAANKVPKIVDPALSLSEIACEFADRHQYELSHTGFSLGGFLAQLTGAHCHHERQKHNKVICFDAPGAKKTIKYKGYSDNRSNTINYLTAPNLVNTITPHYGIVRQITDFEDKNLFLMAELKPLVTDVKASLDIHSPEQGAVDAFKMLIMGTMQLSHNQSDLRSTLASTHSFKFKKVRSWPLSTLGFDKSDKKVGDATSKPLAEDWLGVTSMILSFSKQILVRSGFAEFNVLHYQLPVATVYHHPSETEESFCISTHKADQSLVKTFFNPANPTELPHDQCDEKELKQLFGL